MVLPDERPMLVSPSPSSNRVSGAKISESSTTSSGIPDTPAHYGVDKGEEQKQDQSLRREQRHLELEHPLTSPAGLLARRVYAADEAGRTLAEGQLVAAFDPFAIYGGAV